MYLYFTIEIAAHFTIGGSMTQIIAVADLATRDLRQWRVTVHEPSVPKRRGSYRAVSIEGSIGETLRSTLERTVSYHQLILSLRGRKCAPPHHFLFIDYDGKEVEIRSNEVLSEIFEL